MAPAGRVKMKKWPANRCGAGRLAAYLPICLSAWPPLASGPGESPMIDSQAGGSYSALSFSLLANLSPAPARPPAYAKPVGGETREREARKRAGELPRPGQWCGRRRDYSDASK